MVKKKKFGVSLALQRGISETVNVAENSGSLYRNVTIPISRIELDPKNPRQLNITRDDIEKGLKKDDPIYRKKQEELERLQELAGTIKEKGLLNPIIIYKTGEKYRVVAGERRTLASILAQKTDIEARVFGGKPTNFDLKLVQWVENTAREDLSLAEKVLNIEELVKSHKTAEMQKMTANILSEITALSLSQTKCYLAVIRGPVDVYDAVIKGKITNLDKAALIAGVKNTSLRARLIEQVEKGLGLKDLRVLAKTSEKQESPHQVKARLKTQNFGLGSTNKAEVIKLLVDSVLTRPELEQHRKFFSVIDWTSPQHSIKAFKRLLKIIETDLV